MSLGYSGCPYLGNGCRESVPWAWKHGWGVPISSFACLFFPSSFSICPTHSPEMNTGTLDFVGSIFIWV